MRRAIFVGLMLVLAACASNGGPISIGGPETAWSGNPQGRAWTEMARAAVQAEPALLATQPTDMDAFCPRYAQVSVEAKRDFWVVLLAEIAREESGLDPAAVKVPPKAPGASGDSHRGLLQISVDAANRYGCTNANALGLLDPATNIACGARILAQTSGKDRLVTGYNNGGWRGAAAYWSNLRKPETLADLQARLNAQSFCPNKGRRVS